MTKKGWCSNIEVWYHSKGIANILLLETLKYRNHITYDSQDRDGVLKVHTTQGVVEFMPHESRLHYLDLKENEEAGIALVTTTRENFEGYTKKQVKGTINGRQFQAVLGHPSKKDYESMVHANLIANCSVTPENISNTHKLFGENLARLRGKTVQKEPEQVVMDYVKIPRDMIQTKKFVTLTADVMFVNNLPL